MASVPESPPVSLWQQKPFRMLSFTRLASRTAQNAVNFALVLLIVEETGKSLFSGLLILALVVPATAAGILAGTAADALPKRPLIFLADILRALICIGFIQGSGGIGSYYIVAIALATATQFATNTEAAIQPAVVTRAELARANAISHAIAGIAQIVGYGVVTPLILRVFDNPDVLFGVAAALFVVAAFYALRIGRVRSSPRRDVGGEQAGRWYLTGWRELHRDPRVWQAALELTLLTAALIILGGLIPKYIDDVLDLPVDIGVVILLPGALGVALGLRVAGFLAHRVPHSILSTTGFAGFVVLLAAITFVNQEAEFLSGYAALAWLGQIEIGSFDGGAALAMLLVAPMGFAYALAVVAAHTVVNDLVPLHLQGRTQATQAAIAAAASSIPVLVAGGLSDLVGVTPVLALLAAGVALAAIANMRRDSRPLQQPAGVRS